MQQRNIAISYTDHSLIEKATRLSESLEIDLIDPNDADYEFILLLSPSHLALHQPLNKQFKPFYIDFQTPKLLYRVSHSTQRKELLAKAIGFKPIQTPSIVDATAGCGRDSFMLASLGFYITMLERSNIVATLLQDAMQRASQDARTAATIERMTLVKTNAIEWLRQLTHKPNVIYLDPMFPPRKKAAKVKKEMIVLQSLLHDDASDDVELFDVALACAGNRVVVKRPRIAPFIIEQKPNFSLTGKSSRFDIYIVG